MPAPAGTRSVRYEGVAETSRIRARDSWLAAGAVIGFVLIAIAIRPKPAGPAAPPRDRPVGLGRTAPTSSARTDRDIYEKPPHTHLQLHLGRLVQPLLDLLMVAGVVGAIVLVIVLVPRLQRRNQRVRREASEVPAPDIDEPELADQVSSTFDSALARLLRGEREAAIIACWLQLERAVEAAGFPRADSETSTELVRRLSSTLSLSEQPLTELATLYREARFSSHRMSEQALAAAKQALNRLRAELTGTRSGIDHV